MDEKYNTGPRSTLAWVKRKAPNKLGCKVYLEQLQDLQAFFGGYTIYECILHGVWNDLS